MTDTKPLNTDENAWGAVRIATWVTVGFVLLVVIIFVVGMALAFWDGTYWAPVMHILRDLFTIVVAAQGFLIVLSVSILIVQIARLINLLLNESRPILKNARETAETVSTTARFASQEAIGPIIRLKAFFAGLLVFFRELLAIGCLIRRWSSGVNSDEG